jgi:uncharacterized protein YaeQ
MDVNEYQNTGLPIARPPSEFAVEKYRCQTKTEDSKTKEKERQEKFDNENPELWVLSDQGEISEWICMCETVDRRSMQHQTESKP